MKETLISNRTNTPDARLESLKRWLLSIGYEGFLLKPASQDASFRRYFRMTLTDNKSLVIMDAPPDKESLSPFIEIVEDWSNSKIAVPKIYSFSRELGFLILEDFGNITFLNYLVEDNIEIMYQLAIDELVLIQKHSAKFSLPDYSQELLLTEMNLFIDWFVIKHCQYELSLNEREALGNSFTQLMQSARKQKQLVVHRDYHSRNLMLPSKQKIGVIDFQDAVHGPISYDLVSLLKDCYFKLSDQQRNELLEYYFLQAVENKLLQENEKNQFKQDFELMGIQRHVKAIGIFCRLYHRDGKENYLADIPLTASYIIESDNTNEILSPIIAILEKCLHLIKSSK